MTFIVENLIRGCISIHPFHFHDNKAGIEESSEPVIAYQYLRIRLENLEGVKVVYANFYDLRCSIVVYPLKSLITFQRWFQRHFFSV